MVLVAIEPGQLTVEPGGSATAQIRVRNQSSRVDEFQLSVLGEMSQWATVVPASINLFPRTEGTATLTFSPPRASSPAAGTFPFGVLARSKADTDDSTAEEGTLRVGPFVALSSEVHPRTSRGTRVGEHVVRVRNEGNTPARVNARGLDPDDALASLSVQPTAADVPPGEAAELRATARAKGTRLFGAAQRFPFSVELTEKSGKPEPIQAVFEQRAILPAWILVAAGILVALVVFALGSGVLNPPVETQGPGQATTQPTDATRTEVPGGETQATGSTPTPEVPDTPEPTLGPTAEMRVESTEFDVTETNDQAFAIIGDEHFVINFPMTVNGGPCVARIFLPEFVGEGGSPLGDPASGAEQWGDWRCDVDDIFWQGLSGTLQLDDRFLTTSGSVAFDAAANGNPLRFSATFDRLPIVRP